MISSLVFQLRIDTISIRENGQHIKRILKGGMRLRERVQRYYALCELADQKHIGSII